jgi:hypothetical protein
MGHVVCANESCGKRYKHKPVRCTGLRKDGEVFVVCGGEVFEVACAKCHAAVARAESAPSSYDEHGELGSAGYE